MGDYKRKPKRDFEDRSRGRSKVRNTDSPGERFGRKDFDRPRFDSRDRKPLVMHTVVCDRCGMETEVPFKPTSGKPVYCRDCFNKEDKGRERREGNRGDGRALEDINRKLDKIMKALKIV